MTVRESREFYCLRLANTLRALSGLGLHCLNGGQRSEGAAINEVGPILVRVRNQVNSGMITVGNLFHRPFIDKQ